jgi:hypothetical protein
MKNKKSYLFQLGVVVVVDVVDVVVVAELEDKDDFLRLMLNNFLLFH